MRHIGDISHFDAICQCPRPLSCLLEALQLDNMSTTNGYYCKGYRLRQFVSLGIDRQTGGRIYGGVAWLSFMECSVGSWIGGSEKIRRRAPPSRRTSRSGCWMDTASRGASL